MDGQSALEELLQADLVTRRLVRRLCSSLLAGERNFCDQDALRRTAKQLEDTAYSLLLGLHPEAAPAYVPPDARQAGVAAGLASAATQLQQEGYPSLARDLGAATAKLQGCCTYQLLGSITEAETGAVLALPLTEHASLLGLLLSLQGTRPSLRQQRFTFHEEPFPPPAWPARETPAAAAAAAAGVEAGGSAGLAPLALGPHTPPLFAATPGGHQQQLPARLTSSVFEEAPDPYALTDGSVAVAVLLPSEVGLPTEAMAGREELQELGRGLNSRPLWDPASARSLPPLRSPAWLAVPASLLELRGDARRGARPALLGLPLSLLSMGDEPGCSTLFSPDAAAAGGDWASDGDAASADSVQPLPGPGGGSGSGAIPGMEAAGEGANHGQRGQQQLSLSVKLWSLSEAELAQHALLALQGVAVSLRRLQALLAAPDALPRRSVQPMLQRLAAAGELRQRLHRFVAAFAANARAASPPVPAAAAAGSLRDRRSSGGHGRGAAGSGGGSSAGSGNGDPVQHAFATGVAEVLQRQSAALQQLEQQQGTEWVQTVAVGGTHGTRLHGRGPTLLQVALHTGRLQLQLRRLAGLCWCGPSNSSRPSSAGSQGPPLPGGSEAGGSCAWQAGGFPAGARLLDYLFSQANEADSSDAHMLRFLFVRTLQPYLGHMHAWAYTTHPVRSEFGTAGDKEQLTLDFLPLEERHAAQLVPHDLPSFLQPLHAAFMRAGSQLRLLHSLEGQGRQLAQQLGSIAQQEAAQRNQQPQQTTQQRAAGGGGVFFPQGGAHSVTTFMAAGAAGDAAGSGGAGAGSPGLPAGRRQPWLVLGGAPPLLPGGGGCGADGSGDLQLSSSSLQRAVCISQEQDASRHAAVEGWLGQMALQRRLAEHAAVAEQLGRAAAQQEQQAERAAQQVAALSRQNSSKAALFAEQRAFVREERARRAVQQEQEAASDRRSQLQAAQREHSAAVAELQQALSQAAIGPKPGATPGGATSGPAIEASVAGGSVGDSQGQQEEQAAAAVAAGLPTNVPAAGLPTNGQGRGQQGEQAAVAGAAVQGTVRDVPPALQGEKQATAAVAVAAAAEAGAAAAAAAAGIAAGAAAAGAAAAAAAADRPAAGLSTRPPLPPGLPPLKTLAWQQQQRQQRQQQENAVLLSVRDAPPASGGTTARQPLLPRLPGPLGLPVLATPLVSFRAGQQPLEQQQREQHLTLTLPARPCSSSWGVPAGMQDKEEEEEEEGLEGAAAPLSAVLECCVSQSVQSQYRAVSRACVRLFLDELNVLGHLEALRKFFFMGAGDWADALVGCLGAHADALAPLAGHQLEAALAESLRGTSAEGDPYAAHLRIRLLPASTSAISAQVGAFSSATPQRRAKSFWNSASTVTLAPTQLDALDCVCLDYQVGWPLSAVLTEDTLQGYAAVFSMMARLRRAEQLLRALHAPLAAQPKSSADFLLSEDDADAAHRRIQRLRAFRHGAAQFVAALQAFLHSRTAGDAWVHLLAKLMVSSEEVAATLVAREPMAPMTGVLSRMNSLGPTGKAAHKLAQHMARALGSSQPGSPSAGTTAGTAGRGSSGQLARFTSLLSAASAASSAANSAATSPRESAPLTSRQLSRFAVPNKAPAPGINASAAAATSAAADAAVAAVAVPASARPSSSGSRAAPAAGPFAATSPTAGAAGTAGGALLSRAASSTSVLLAQAAAEAGRSMGGGSGSGGGGGGGAGDNFDAAAWARHFQQSQQGIADLQELLDLHRRYVRQASEDCLTFGGSPEVQSAVAGALQCLVDFAFRLRGTVRSGAGHRAEETWTQVLRLADTWRPLAAAMSDFEGRVQQLQGLLQHSSSKSALAELTLDYNFYYQKQVDRRAARDQRKAAAAEAKLTRQRATVAGFPADRQWSPAAASTSPGRQAAAGVAAASERRAWGAAGGGREMGA